MKLNGFDCATRWDAERKTYCDRLSIVFTDMHAVHCELPIGTPHTEVIEALHKLISTITAKAAEQ